MSIKELSTQIRNSASNRFQSTDELASQLAAIPAQNSQELGEKTGALMALAGRESTGQSIDQRKVGAAWYESIPLVNNSSLALRASLIADFKRLTGGK
ncbi:hypothetical protein [Methylobacter sp. YRD-M1]|uniref:hypothetical protein n=1 Tax=Methylobacter sp. YRD-M1 TaxID=2911520 RepID=UPI00227D0790|nr:hypothetical protein [Methylobacter sp. YRD-M1]WAK02784.1 hypothetical protein LZ558_03065 [Methylobacter sp. YRD-M1]